MILKHLKWFTLPGLIGVIGWFLNQPMFFGLFGLFIFIPLFWYDERTEEIFRKAASVAFVIGVITYAGVFVYLGLLLGIDGRNADGINRGEMLGNLVVVWALTYSLILLSFSAAHAYFQHKGN